MKIIVSYATYHLVHCDDGYYIQDSDGGQSANLSPGIVEAIIQHPESLLEIQLHHPTPCPLTPPFGSWVNS